MAIFDILKKELFIESDETTGDEPIVEDEEGSIDGDPQALVNGMIENAPGSKEQIGIILKYAANSIPDYDVWDAALDYYESLADDVEDAAQDAGIGDDDGEELPPEEGDDELPIDDGGEELPPEDEEEKEGDGGELSLSM